MVSCWELAQWVDQQKLSLKTEHDASAGKLGKLG